jgi:AsmA protein
MNRFLKYSLLTTSFTAILITGLIIFFLDPDNYKSLIIKHVKKEMHRELKFEGDISLTIFPKLRISLKHFSLSEYKSSKKFVTAEHIHFTLPLKSLLRNRLVIDEIIVTRPKAALIRFPDGRMNIDDLLATDEKTTAFDIGDVRIDDAALVLHDTMSKKQVILRDMTLGIHKITDESLDQLELKTTGTIVNIGGNKDKQNVAIRLNIPNLQFNNNSLESNYVNLAILIANPANRITGTFSLSNITAATNRFNSDVMTVKLAAKKDAQTVRIHLKSSLTGNPETQKFYLPNLKANFTAILPDLPNQLIRGSLAGKIFVASLSERLQANLAGNLEDGHIQAKFNLSNFSNPTIDFDIAIDTLNIDRWFSSADKQNRQHIETQLLDEAIDFSLLAELNANGSIYIGMLQSADVTLSGMEFKIKSDHYRQNSATTLLDNASVK